MYKMLLPASTIPQKKYKWVFMEEATSFSQLIELYSLCIILHFFLFFQG